MDEDELLTEDEIDCRNCEANYTVKLGEGFLQMSVAFCPFCSEPIFE